MPLTTGCLDRGRWFPGRAEDARPLSTTSRFSRLNALPIVALWPRLVDGAVDRRLRNPAGSLAGAFVQGVGLPGGIPLQMTSLSGRAVRLLAPDIVLF